MALPGPLFVTGGSGFVGRALLRSVSSAGTRDVICLARDAAAFESVTRVPPGWRVVTGDLAAPALWEQELPKGGTVLHMAAVTGKAHAREYEAVNAEGTRRLVASAEARGVRRFVFVSSIAAGFRDVANCPYARSKAEAEQFVRESGMAWTIVRPTQVFGPGSPVLKGLVRLALAPVGVVFGSGRVRVQPVHVDDLAMMLMTILREESLHGEVLELGGPESLPIEDLLRRLRRGISGRSGPWIRVPLRPIQWSLAWLEPLLLPVLPLTAGQLASFSDANDGGATPPSIFEAPADPLRPITAMIAEWAEDA